MVAPATQIIPGTNPFVGPRSFQTGEHLYGRSREGAELVDLLIAERVVLLYSPSGAGKSSLINAMVIPQMQTEGFMVSPVVRVNLEPPPGCESIPGFNRYASSVMRSLEEGVPEQARYSLDQLANMDLPAYIQDYRQRMDPNARNFDPNGDLLLIVDQFEEVLRISASDSGAKSAFFSQLGDMLRNRNIWALIALREDYLAALEPYSRPIPNRFGVTYRLDFLSAHSAIEAIQGPARESGVPFDDDAAAQLVENLRSIRVQQADGTTVDQPGPYVEPVQLQVVCRRLWEKAAEKKVVTLKDVSEAGNIDDALSDYYDEQVAAASTGSGVTERQIREWFDRKLIALSGIRGQVLMEPEASGGLSNKAIKLLQEAYLVRADKRGNATWFELAHDRLTRPIRRNNAEWFAAHLNVFQRQADLWNNQGRPDALLLRGQAYVDAETWAKDSPDELLPSEKDFLKDSGEEYQSTLRQHRLNLIIRWAAVFMTVLAVAAFAFFMKAQAAERRATANAILADKNAEQASENAAEADKQRELALQKEQDAKINSQIAEIQKLAAQSVSNLAVDPGLSVTVALQAVNDIDLNQTDMQENMKEALKSVEDALRQALPAVRVEQVFKDASIGGDEAVSHAGTAWSASFDPGGRRVATAGDEGTVKVWDTFTGRLLNTIPVFTPPEGGKGVTNVAFSPDGKRLAAATGNGRILLYDAATFGEIDTIPVQRGIVWGLAFSPDSNRLLIGGEAGVAEILDLQAGTKPLILAGHDGTVNAVAFSPDGARVATGDAGGLVLVWDAGTGQVIFRLQGHTGMVNGVAFRPDGKQLATSGEDRTIKVWDLAANGRKVIDISGHRDWVYAIAFTKDGSNLISVSADRTVRFWDTTYGRPGMVLYGHKDQVFGLALSPDGKRIATTSKDRTVRIWNISPEGSRELITFDNRAAVYDIALSPDGHQLVSAGGDNIARVMNATSGQVLFTLSGHNGILEGVAYSPDGRKIATCSRDGTARIWDAVSGKELITFSKHQGTIWDIAFSPDGKRVATASQDNTVKIWDPATGDLLYDLKSIWGAPLSLAFSPNASVLAAGYADSHIVLWDPQTGERLKVLSGHTDMVQALTFRPDGQVLASAGDDGTIILWDMDPLRWGQSQAPIRGRGDTIFDIAFSSDGKSLFSGGADGIGTLWDLQDRNVDFQTYGHTDRLYAAELSPDGKFLYTGGRDGTIRTFVFSFDELLKLAGKRTTREFTEEECRQYLNAACPADVAPPAEVPSDVQVKRPADTSPAADAKWLDANSSVTASALEANGGDQFVLGLFERPFNGGEMNVYYPDIDITSASMSQDKQWVYSTITLADVRGESLMGNYAIELDLDGDGRGDLLITTLTPGKDWSTNGVRIWEDKNRDVGNNVTYISDPPQTGDGYETLLFDQGTGDAPDLAWSRVVPTDPKSIQLAFQRSVIDNDSVFVWLAWASRDVLKPAWFDYNDHFTRAQAGSPIKGQANYPLQALAGVDNTCRVAVGFAPEAGQQAFCSSSSSSK